MLSLAVLLVSWLTPADQLTTAARVYPAQHLVLIDLLCSNYIRYIPVRFGSICMAKAVSPGVLIKHRTPSALHFIHIVGPRLGFHSIVDVAPNRGL